MNGQPDEMVMKTQPKQFWVAFVLNFLLAGAGHIYAGRNQTGAIFLVVNVISWALVVIYIGWVGVMITWIWALADTDAAVKAFNTELEEKKGQIEEKTEKEKQERATDEQEKKETVVTSKDIVEALMKSNKLFSSEIISKEEFEERKATLIGGLQFKEIEGDPDDVLLAIAPMVQSGVISQDEVKALKKVLFTG